MGDSSKKKIEKKSGKVREFGPNFATKVSKKKRKKGINNGSGDRELERPS